LIDQESLNSFSATCQGCGAANELTFNALVDGQMITCSGCGAEIGVCKDSMPRRRNKLSDLFRRAPRS
jgi:hypothetical protein